MIKKTDPLYPHLADVLVACPSQAGPLYTAFKDLALSIEWHDLRALVLPGTQWAVIIGHKHRSEPLKAVLPLPLHTSELRPSSLRAIFKSLAQLRAEDIGEAIPPLVPSIDELRDELDRRRKARHPNESTDPSDTPPDISIQDGAVQKDDAGEVNEELDRDMIYMAIATTDSTVVYYKLAKGIKKPADIPDE